MQSSRVLYDKEASQASFDIKIIYENSTIEEGFLSGYGLSILIYNHFTEDYVLFDTGSNGEILLNNIQQFDISPLEIKKVVISHNHKEHVGGLDALYEANKDIEIYIPIENKILYQRKYSRANVIGVSEFLEIDSNIYSTGQLGTYLKEQALFLKTIDDEIIILVGCSHPGLDEITSMAKSIAPIKAIIGGFHNLRNFTCLQNIKFIGACHCTQYLDLVLERFPEQYNSMSVGKSLIF
ncbi:MAG: MBL fold metallo-hydrolase [Promethearchaeota archaeon]|nr:MAG: MBL fold metallo-hydrolase [Candidatus Lokiarchaeota archaeon]